MFLFKSSILLSGISFFNQKPKPITSANAISSHRTSVMPYSVCQDSFHIQNKNSKLAFVTPPINTFKKASRDRLEHGCSNNKKLSTQFKFRIYSLAPITLNNEPSPEPENPNNPNVIARIEAPRGYKLVYQRLYPFGEALAAQAQSQFPDSIAQIKEILAPHGQVKGRPKSAGSITEKLARKSIKDGLVYVDLATAKCIINDAIGTRLIMWNGNMADSDKVVLSLINAIRSGKIQVTKISNFCGESGIPYFTDNHIEALIDASSNYELLNNAENRASTMTDGKVATKASGYTTAQMDIFHRNGALRELQVRGPLVDRFADVEHIIYDIRQGKALHSNYSPSFKKEFEEIRNSLNSFSEEEMACYLAHIRSVYTYYRLIENKIIPIAEPRVPKLLQRYPHLDLVNIERLYNQALITHDLQKRKFPFSISGEDKNRSDQSFAG